MGGTRRHDGGFGAEEADEVDTDTKLAMLASLLEPASYPTDELLEALQGADGDVAKAAEALLLPRVKSAGKRKAGTSLESWLGGKKRHENVASPRLAPTPTEPTQRKPAVDLLSILKQPADMAAAGDKVKNAPRPALHLPDQSAIDSHRLPLTLLRSPLSPALASALYLTMMDESETWERNRFYLAGKWVESPHTVCHYARDPPTMEEKDIETLQGKEGKKATYMWSGQEIPSARVSQAGGTATANQN